MRGKGFLQDEQGNASSARLSWWIVFPFSLAAVAAESLGLVAVSPGGYALLGTMLTFILVWTSGPRMAQYLAGQIGKAVQAVGAAAAQIKERREQGKPHGEEPA